MNLIIYLIFWLIITATATVLLTRRYNKVYLQSYLKFLFVPWKLVTFMIAMTGITLAAPYSGDITWDYFDSIVISLLTYLFSPWTVGVFYLFIKRKASWQRLFIAIAALLFSSSWFYDGYILLRDGHYPSTWISNLIISPAFFIAAGLFWNLEFVAGQGAKFSFQIEGWYSRKVDTSFKRILLISLPFMIFAAYGVFWFVWKYFFH